MIIETYTVNEYRTEVFDDAMVKVYKNDSLIDNPGPWTDIDAAKQWAEAIVADYAENGLPQPLPRP